MRIYVIRHADPDYENNTITPDGHKEAAALAERLSKENLHRIYSSPAGRAIDTMQYTAKRVGLEPAIEEWTTELPGLGVTVEPWGDGAAWNIPGEVILRGTVPTLSTWHKGAGIGSIGEKAKRIYEEMRLASDAFLERHGYRRDGTLYRCVQPNRERIAVFCHHGFGLAWLSHLLHLPVTSVWSSFWLPPSSVTTVLFEERSDQWAVPRCIAAGDTSHLYAAGLAVKPRGITANYD